MASVLIGACFSCSLAHPQRNADFATYVPKGIWDGADLFSNPYDCNPEDVMVGVEVASQVWHCV